MQSLRIQLTILETHLNPGCRLSIQSLFLHDNDGKKDKWYEITEEDLWR